MMLCLGPAVVKYDGMKGLPEPSRRGTGLQRRNEHGAMRRSLFSESTPIGGAELNDMIHHGGLGPIGLAPLDGLEDPAMGGVGDLLLPGHPQADAALLPQPCGHGVV